MISQWKENWTETEVQGKGTLCLCCGKWDFQCGPQWNHDPRNSLLGSHPDINICEGWPSVWVCALMMGCVYTVCWAVLAEEQECYVLAIDFITLGGFSLGNAGFNPSPLKAQSTAEHNIQAKATIYRWQWRPNPLSITEPGVSKCVCGVFTYCKSLCDSKDVCMKAFHLRFLIYLRLFPACTLCLIQQALAQEHHFYAVVAVIRWWPIIAWATWPAA